MGINLDNVIIRTNEIDAGEWAVDRNRWVWDSISTVLSAGTALSIRV